MSRAGSLSCAVTINLPYVGDALVRTSRTDVFISPLQQQLQVLSTDQRQYVLQSDHAFRLAMWFRWNQAVRMGRLRREEECYTPNTLE